MQISTLPKLDIVTPTIVQNCTSSAAFMKQLTAIAISTLIHFKSNFPKENNFNEETFGGTKVWVLKRHCENKIAQFVTDSIINAFEAMDKRYLHQLALCFYEDGTSMDKLLEYYLFEFNYSTPGISVGIKNKETDKTKKLADLSFEEVEKCTKSLIRACNMMALGFPTLPKDYTISIRLFYNNDAPEDYHPSGFTSANSEDGDVLSALDEKILLGGVSTPFHHLELSSYARMRVDKASYEANPSDNAPWMETEELAAPFRSPSQDTLTSVTCPCNNFQEVTVQTPNKHSLLIQCIHCHNYQHAICFGVFPRDKDSFPEHCCNDCFYQDRTRTPTDYKYFYILEQDSARIKTLYLLRHAIFLCSELHSIDVMAIINYFGVREKHAWEIFQSLLEHKFLLRDKEPRISTPLQINAEQLKVGILNYFYTDCNLTDRLVDESVASSSIQYDTDPLGNLLTHVENKSLAKNKIYSIVSQEECHQGNDENIKQFRDVILKNTQPVSDEMPLSGSHNPVQEFKDKTKNKRKNFGKKLDDGEKKTKKGRK